MHNILVTGGTGYIGDKLVSFLNMQGYKIHILCRASSDTSNIPDEVDVHILENWDDIYQIFSSNKFDLVAHLATQYQHSFNQDNITDTIQANVLFGTHILNAMKENNCRRLINTTSCAEFSSVGEFDPNSLYAATKKAFRDLTTYFVNHEGFNVIDLVLYDNYGPNDSRMKITNLLVNHLKSSNPLNLSPGEQKLNMVHIDDTVLALGLSIETILVSEEQCTQKLYCIAPSKAVTLRELASTIERVSEHKLSIVWGGKPYRENEIMQPWVGTRLPGWNTKTSLENGILDLIKHI